MFSGVVQVQDTTHTRPLKHTSSDHFYENIIFMIVFIFLATRRAFQVLANYRAIKGTPTSLIRSAAQGYVELNGIQTCPLDKPLTSPLTFSSCTWFDYIIEKKVSHSKRNVSWKTIYHYSSKTPIMLRDKTGECWILPAKAEVSTADIFMCYASSGTPWNESYPANQKLGSFLRFLWNKVSMLYKPYRHTEKIMKINDPIYAIGFFCSYQATEQNDVMRQLRDSTPAAQTPGNKNVLSVSDNRQTPFLLASKTEKKLMREQLWDFLLWIGVAIFIFSLLVSLVVLKHYRN